MSIMNIAIKATTATDGVQSYQISYATTTFTERPTIGTDAFPAGVMLVSHVLIVQTSGTSQETSCIT